MLLGRDLQDRLLKTSTSVHKAGHRRSDTTPRVRGLPQCLLFTLIMQRYNPACAGKLTCSMRRLRHTTIQPRVCGDYVDLLRRSRPLFDTTPRVRGNFCVACQGRQCPRYNPACAGKLTCSMRRLRHTTIQPRVCGDYVDLLRRSRPLFDTTPRVRGNFCVACQGRQCPRYNPACAGKLVTDEEWSRIQEIQPRVCGETFSAKSLAAACCDTTPRVRGNCVRDLLIGRLSRYNPACAGKLDESETGQCQSAIQPRVCGETARS